MNNQQWQFFCDFKNQFRQKVDEWNKKIPELIQYEQAAAIQAGTPSYNFENVGEHFVIIKFLL